MKYNWMKSLYLVRGMAGEGKSTLALELMEGNKDQVVESDDFWTYNGKYTYDKETRYIAGWWSWAEAFRKLQFYDNIAVANMFRRKELIDGYIKYAQEQEIVVYVVRANSRLNPVHAWERNVHNIPKQDFEHLIKEWEEYSDEEIFEMAKKKIFVVDHQEMLETGILTRDAD